MLALAALSGLAWLVSGCHSTSLARPGIVAICQHSALGSSLPNELRQHADLVTMVSPMWYQVSDTGTIAPMKGVTAEGVAAYVAFAHAHGVQMVPILRNFNPKAFLADATAQATSITEAMKLLEREHFDGFMVDFERMDETTRQAFVAYLAKLHPTMTARHTPMLVAVPPRSWNNAIDYAGTAAHCDILFVMGYDYAGPWRLEAAATAPLDNPARSHDLRRDLTALLGLVPPSKLILGVPFYGNDFTFNQAGKVERCDAFALERLAEVKGRFGAQRRWDSNSKTPWYAYRDDHGVDHQVWYEDRESFAIKLNFAAAHGFAGCGAWAFRNPEVDSGIGFWQALADLPPATPSR